MKRRMPCNRWPGGHCKSSLIDFPEAPYNISSREIEKSIHFSGQKLKPSWGQVVAKGATCSWQSQGLDPAPPRPFRITMLPLNLDNRLWGFISSVMNPPSWAQPGTQTPPRPSLVFKLLCRHTPKELQRRVKGSSRNSYRGTTQGDARGQERHLRSDIQFEF